MFSCGAKAVGHGAAKAWNWSIDHLNFGGDICLAVCLGLSQAGSQTQVTVGGIGFGGWWRGGGPESGGSIGYTSATPQEQDPGNGQICAAYYAGGCFQMGHRAGTNNGYWYGGQIVRGTGVFFGFQVPILSKDWGDWHIDCD
jgi:hypothetical protein